MIGGIRSRLVVDCFRIRVVAGLIEEGWFESGRRHDPVTYIPRPAEWDDGIRPNAIAITPEDVRSEGRGLGEEYSDSTRIYVDIFAESDAVGRHLAYDVRDILLGKRDDTEPLLEVFDLREDPPEGFIRLELDDVIVDQASGFPKPWQRYWWVVRADVVDDFDETVLDTVDVPEWTDSLAAGWALLEGV